MKQLDAETQNAVVFAADEARDLGHTQIGTEHLLLGLVRLGGTSAERLGLSLQETRATVRGAVGRGTGRRTIGELQFTGAARRALARARALADPRDVTPRDLIDALLTDRGSGASRITGGHGDRADELLAEAANPASVVARALTSLGVDEHELRDAVDRIRRGAVQS